MNMAETIEYAERTKDQFAIICPFCGTKDLIEIGLGVVKFHLCENCLKPYYISRDESTPDLLIKLDVKAQCKDRIHPVDMLRNYTKEENASGVKREELTENELKKIRLNSVLKATKGESAQK